jgi:hypothetical protein
MTRAGLLFTAVLAAASVGVFAQDSSQSASAPPQVSTQSSPSSATQPGAAQPSSPKPAATGQAGATSDELNSTQQLPQTSTFLPLLGLIGLGSLVAGLFARR